MTEHRNIEETLQQFRHVPSARVKRTVMSAYEASLAPRSESRFLGVWKRPVPLYAVALAIFVVIGISFVAGQSVAPSGRQQAVTEPSAPAVDIEWSPAARDLL